MGCYHSKKRKTPGYEEPLFWLRKHLEEFQIALFRNRNMRKLFADRIFYLFDVKRNEVIEFGEFVRSLGIFHPEASIKEKIIFAFRLNDLRQTGFIEQEELNDMVLALLHESELILSDGVIETILEKTFKEADVNGDGKRVEGVCDEVSIIDQEHDITILKGYHHGIPKFVASTDVEDSDMK